MKQTLCMVLLIPVIGSVALALAIVSEPQNGDIRLAGGSSVRGRLEVFNGTTNVWGTVCYSNRSAEVNWEMGAARAACRQLGYLDATKVGSVTQLNFPPAPEATPILLYDLSCVYNKDVSDLNNEFEHILRCEFSEEGSCNHTQDMAIECTNTSKYASPYSTEVRLVGGDYPSHGVVEVYLNDRWGTVCADNMTTDNAYSVCRQMGYTRPNSFSRANPVNNTLPSVKTLTCSVPHPCFSSCYSYPLATDTFTCVTNKVAAVTCTFDLSGKKFTPGNEATCQATSPSHWIRLAEIIGGAVGGLVLVLILPITTVCCCCFIGGCPLHSWRERRLYGYDSIN